MSIASIEDILITFIKHQFEDIEQENKYGGILFKIHGGKHFCGVFSYKNHVSLEFPLGYKLNDPSNSLQGSGKYRRHLKFQNEDDILLDVIAKLLSQACELSNDTI